MNNVVISCRHYVDSLAFEVKETIDTGPAQSASAYKEYVLKIILNEQKAVGLGRKESWSLGGAWRLPQKGEDKKEKEEQERPDIHIFGSAVGFTG